MFIGSATIRRFLFGIVMLCITLVVSAWPVTRSRNINQVKDTLTVQAPTTEIGSQRRMSMSAYPIQMHVTGRAVRIQSDHNQILPIYTQSGAFYMAMRLTKGTNWLNGLPRGRYFINNRPIVIN